MVTQPTHDWGNDYDIFDEEYVRDPYPIWDELREKCPVAHTERWHGSWHAERWNSPRRSECRRSFLSRSSCKI